MMGGAIPLPLFSISHDWGEVTISWPIRGKASSAPPPKLTSNTTSQSQDLKEITEFKLNNTWHKTTEQYTDYLTVGPHRMLAVSSIPCYVVVFLVSWHTGDIQCSPISVQSLGYYPLILSWLLLWLHIFGSYGHNTEVGQFRPTVASLWRTSARLGRNHLACQHASSYQEGQHWGGA